jgi:hypothetical protein
MIMVSCMMMDGSVLGVRLLWLAVLMCARVLPCAVLIKASFLDHDYCNQDSDYLPRFERHVSNGDGVQNAKMRVMREILWLHGNRVMSSWRHDGSGTTALYIAQASTIGKESAKPSD